MRVCTCSEIREIDQLAETEYCIDAQILMENAGRGAVEVFLDEYPDAGKQSEILVFAGKGNNAGDAFVVARRLICLDRRVRIFHVRPFEEYTGPSKRNFEILRNMKAKMLHLDTASELEAFFASSSGPFTVIDGLLGTGLKGNLSGIFYDLVEMINRHSERGFIREVVSMDIPSGVNGDSGEVCGSSIQANLTVSFGFPKLGHFLPPGAASRGKLVNVDISLPPRFRQQGSHFLLRPGPMASLLNERDRYGHKNSFGHTLLIGGSPGRIGAICMAANACHKMGTGLATVASWDDSMPFLLPKLSNETMGVPILTEPSKLKKLREILEQYSSIVVGPGLGRRPEGKRLMEEILSNYNGPLVIDADALNIIADHQLHSLIVKRNAKTILTPHPGEMSRLLDTPKDQIVRSPIAAVKRAVQMTHAVVLLKGAATVMSSPDDVVYVNHYPNDGMATAGTGDVLAGMIGGLVGQQMEVFSATQLAVFLHSLAGSIAAEKFGHRSMTAPDIVRNIGSATQQLKKSKHPSVPEEARAVLH